MRSLLALVPIDGVAERMQPMRPLVLEPGALALEAEALDCRFRSEDDDGYGVPDAAARNREEPVETGANVDDEAPRGHHAEVPALGARPGDRAGDVRPGT